MKPLPEEEMETQQTRNLTGIWTTLYLLLRFLLLCPPSLLLRVAAEQVQALSAHSRPRALPGRSLHTKNGGMLFVAMCGRLLLNIWNIFDSWFVHLHVSFCQVRITHRDTCILCRGIFTKLTNELCETPRKRIGEKIRGSIFHKRQRWPLYINHARSWDMFIFICQGFELLKDLRTSWKWNFLSISTSCYLNQSHELMINWRRFEDWGGSIGRYCLRSWLWMCKQQQQLLFIVQLSYRWEGSLCFENAPSPNPASVFITVCVLHVHESTAVYLLELRCQCMQPLNSGEIMLMTYISITTTAVPQIFILLFICLFVCLFVTGLNYHQSRRNLGKWLTKWEKHLQGSVYICLFDQSFWRLIHLTFISHKLTSTS